MIRGFKPWTSSTEDSTDSSSTMNPPSQQQTGKKPQKRFQFIDNSNIGSNSANSTQVRRHVMQEYMREKRWESRTRTDEESSDAAVQTHLRPESHSLAPTPARKKAAPRIRKKHQRSAPDKSKPEPIASNPALQQQQPAGLVRTDRYDFSPPSFTQTSVSQAEPETTEEIPRSFAPASQLEPKRPRRGFYLTPQSFASIADVGRSQSSTPPSTSGHRTSSSPTSSQDAAPVARRNPSTFHRNGPPPFSSSDLSVDRNTSSCSLSSILSSARTDPFDSLPMTLTKEDQELFDFYANVMPACSYGFERRSPKAHNWYISVFIPEAMKSAVAFQNTVLVHAANTQAWVRGLSETPLAVEHRARASEMLSTHFQEHPHDISDAAISSTLSAAALEDFDPRLERRQYAWMHWHAAVQKIRDRGGPGALEQHKSLRMLINWSDYIFSGYNSYGASFFFTHQNLPLYTTPAIAEATAHAEVAQQCEEFIIFLKCAESLALVASNMRSVSATRTSQSMRYTVFTPGQPLYNLLSSPNGPRYTNTGQLKQIISRLAALMTITVAIWEYRYSPTATEEFFRELMDNIKHNNLDVHISVEALLQILLSGSENPNLVHTERPWLIGRLLKVAKRLSRNSWEHLNDFLLNCLTLTPPLVPKVEVWEPGLRAEILSAPLIGIVLPLMSAI